MSGMNLKARVAALALTMLPTAPLWAKDAEPDYGQDLLESYGFTVQPGKPACGWNTLTYLKMEKDQPYPKMENTQTDPRMENTNRVVFNLHDKPAHICEFPGGRSEVGAIECNKKEVTDGDRNKGWDVYNKNCAKKKQRTP